MKKEDKQEITLGTTVKAVITGYVAYGILIGFVAYMIGIIVNWFFESIPGIDMRTLSITLPIIEAILIYFLIRGIAKLSIFDVFKKCKTNSENLGKVNSRLSLFIIVVVTLYVVGSIIITQMDWSSKQESIIVSSYRYQNIHSENYAKKLTNEMITEFEEEKVNTIISTVILELGMVISLFSVIPLQRKLIDEANEF